jgi:anti-anti-sigma factor
MNPQTTVLPGGHVVVALSGELDVDTVPEARNALDSAVGQAVTGVIINLAEVTFLDAAGLGVLVRVSKNTQHLPDGVRLAAVPAHVRRLLEVTGLSRDLNG